MFQVEKEYIMSMLSRLGYICQERVSVASTTSDPIVMIGVDVKPRFKSVLENPA